MPELVRTNVPGSPHMWRWRPQPCYIGPLAAGLGNLVFIKCVAGSSKSIYCSAYRIERGTLIVPDARGFGLPQKA